ncbi:Electron transport complex subunit RsxG [Planctomycetes bacterium Pan216]|uniref:Electron transport complex subunit RsxG n=1 Tax=Kolteria novifilia TaxID=2527975 RepID=A0A518AY68_9BACT|nr:Electron transport complex subunit RsxG [Planctomycetes bacterium Pan216]
MADRSPNELSILESPSPPRGTPWRRWGLHLLRWTLVLAILCLIRANHQRHLAEEKAQREVSAGVDSVLPFFPRAARFTGTDPVRGGRYVVDEDGTKLGYVLQTSPMSDDIIGYSGPNNTLIAFGTDDRVVGIDLVSSGDTEDHVAQVVAHAPFMTGFNGLTWEDLEQLESVQAVSGATLTSLALAEGVLYRVRGSKPSFRFPDPVTLKEIQRLFPDANAFRPTPASQELLEIRDTDDRRVGFVARTSPRNDHRIGYRGPTDALLGIDPTGNHVTGIAIKESYDTPVYVEDVTSDYTFMRGFREMPLEELASWEEKDTQAHAVSGATMTSAALVDSLAASARSILYHREAPATPVWEPRLRDLGLGIVVVVGLMLSFSNLRGKLWLRRLFQVFLVLYVGFVSGDLLSQALLVGWAEHGVPWRIATGLVLVGAVAFLVPLTTKKQWYCHHYCPYGAAQELVKQRLPWRWKIPHRLHRLLKLTPLLLLAWVLVVTFRHLDVDLASIEPFDAFIFRVAGWGTIAVAVAGLIVSLFVPMAYCQYACPTGALLKFLRFNNRSDRLGGGDWAAILLLATALLLSLP